MATNNNAPATKVIVPCRISFANIWEARSINGGDEKYSVSLLIPKDDKATLAKIKKAIEAAKEAAKEKGYVEKGNKDETFKYHIAKVDDEDDALQEEPVLTNEDFVLGIRPEFIAISPDGAIEGEIYGAMPTGMETTVRIRVGNYLLTSVMFGGLIYKIGQKVRLSFTGNNVMLFSRVNGKLITEGSLDIRS